MDQLSSPDFAVHDQYRCPQGQLLLPTHREEQAQLVEYRASAGTCNACPLKAHCTPNKRGRHVHRSFFADYQERVKGYHQTDAYQKAMGKRKVWVEPLFAEARVLAWHAAIPLEEARALSIARRRSSQRGKISNACCIREDGDGVRFQRRGWLRWLFPMRKQMSP
jgi:hypothetical protein